VDNSSPRSQWPLGRVLEAYPDEHGVVRSVLVRLKGREIKRPIHKLCLIQPSDENESANGGRWTRDLERGLRLPRSLDVRVTTECTIHDFYNCLTYEWRRIVLLRSHCILNSVLWLRNTNKERLQKQVQKSTWKFGDNLI